MTTTPTQAARVRSLVDHPIIDADGHFVELGPLLQDEVISYVEDAGGAALRERFLAHRARRSTRRRAWPTAAIPTVREQWKAMPSWWGWQTHERARPRHRRTSPRCSTSASTSSASTSRSSTRRWRSGTSR